MDCAKYSESSESHEGGICKESQETFENQHSEISFGSGNGNSLIEENLKKACISSENVE